MPVLSTAEKSGYDAHIAAANPHSGSTPTSRSLTAGAGLTGGGDLSANRTFNVVANADGSIVVNADDVQVGVLASDAQHGARGGGTQHAAAVSAGAAGFMTGADKAILDALNALKTSGYTLVSEGIATGTAQPLLISDAVMAGLVAGGSTSGAGVAGVVATSFGSSGAETGTGSNQGGLGSTAAATQPYNATDFPGQHYTAAVAVLRADGDEILLKDVLTSATGADQHAKVYGYIAFRSDASADQKWRIWWYYRRASDGFETPFTPNASLSNCKLYVPRVFAITSAPVAAGLGNVVAGQSAAEVLFGATGDIATLGTAAAAGTTGRVMDAGSVIPHGNQTVDTLHALATSSAHGFMDKADKATFDQFFANGPRSMTYFVDDFRGGTGAGTASGLFALNWRGIQNGTGATLVAVTTNEDDTHIGVVQFATGTTNTGRAAIGLQPSTSALCAVTWGTSFDLYQEWLIRIPTLSDGTDTYALRIGYGHDLGAGDFANGVYFEYLHTTSANWLLVANLATARTVTTSSTAVAAGAWLRLGIRKASGSNTATFEVNGSSIGTVTTGFPTLPIDPAMKLEKSVGTNSRTVLLDYYWERMKWATPRAA